MNTHVKYQTKNHHHFDWNYQKADGSSDYPHSALMLVECADGRWFLQQEFGDEYSRFAGVLKSGEDLDTEPTFYPDVQSAARAAFNLMKQAYPGGYDDPKYAEWLDEFLADD